MVAGAAFRTDLRPSHQPGWCARKIEAQWHYHNTIPLGFANSEIGRLKGEVLARDHDVQLIEAWEIGT